MLTIEQLQIKCANLCETLFEFDNDCPKELGFNCPHKKCDLANQSDETTDNDWKSYQLNCWELCDGTRQN